MTNLSQQKREAMLSFLSKLKELHGDDESLHILNQIETEINEKRYGLIWEEHSEHVDQMLVDNIPVFADVPEKTIIAASEEKFNFLLEGDNLHSLQLLTKTHLGKIDLIIIDPPYNTGNKDFIYDDSYIDKVDSYAHSKWLSFMNRRLELAKELLSKNGVIFINIDDNEHSQLKLLCDHVFGEANFITSIPWHNRTSMQNDTDISVNHEYILVYAKYKRPDNRRLKDSNRDVWEQLEGFTFLPKETDVSKFENPDNDERGMWKADPFDAPNIRPNLTYPIVNPNTGVEYYPPKGRCWRTTQENYLELLKDNRIVFGKTGTSKPQLKVFYSDVKYKGAVPDSWFEADIYGTSTSGKKELLKLLPEVNTIFSTPKPSKLCLEIMKLSIANNKDAIVLDFFAGSGTTGHAVQQLNKEDGGNRTYILCTNNENNICEEVTYQRLSKIQTDLPHNLRYYRTDFIPKYDEEDDEHSVTDATLEHIQELIELEHQTYLDGKHNALLLENDEKEYILMHVEQGANVYATSWIFFEPEDHELIEEKGINLVYIPDYYFEEELIEVGEL